MPNKSMPEIKKAKWHCMLLIKERLKQEPMTFGQILEYLSNKGTTITKRTVQNYIEELKALQIIQYDAASGFYSSLNNKLYFETKADYDIALEHSHKIFFSDEQSVGIDFADGAEVLRRLAFLEDTYTDANKDEFGTRRTDFYYDNYYLLRHIQTGYPETNNLIKKYRRLALKQGITSSFVHETIPPQYSKVTKQTLTKNEKAESGRVIEQFKDDLHRIIRQVKDGVPLYGYCDGCPGRKVAVKGVQRQAC